VWAVLTDFAAYPDWNPFISRIEGSLEVGRKLTVRLQPPGGRGLTFKPTVQAADPGRHLGWLGHLIVSGGVRRREFALGPTADGRTHLLQRETFSGVLVALLGRTMEKTSSGFDQLNQALKVRVELRTAHT